MHLKQITVFIACIITMHGCSRDYLGSRFDIPAKRLSIKQGRYIRHYGFLPGDADTVIATKHLYRQYNNGVLTKIGRLKNQHPIGYWFVFKDTFDTKYILRYNVNTVDSFESPFAIVQRVIHF